MIDAPLRILYTSVTVVIGLVHVLLPFMVLPIYSSLSRIDPKLTEAAANLGSSPVKAFLEITLPLSLPGVFAGSVLCFVLSFSSYVTPALLAPSDSDGRRISGSVHGSVPQPVRIGHCDHLAPSCCWCSRFSIASSGLI